MPLVEVLLSTSTHRSGQDCTLHLDTPPSDMDLVLCYFPTFIREGGGELDVSTDTNNCKNRGQGPHTQEDVLLQTTCEICAATLRVWMAANTTTTSHTAPVVKWRPLDFISRVMWPVYGTSSAQLYLYAHSIHQLFFFLISSCL